jgi:tetratricopeptide (TPR) repeat protein
MGKDADTLRASAIDLHQQQRLIEAQVKIAEAQALAPNDPILAFMYAQFRYELGLAAASDFAHAQNLWPDNAELIRNHALALHSEGQTDAAIALVKSNLANNPGWINGHQTLATIAWTSGDRNGFADSYAQAARANPRSASLWIAWFQAIAQLRDWDAATSILDEASQHIKGNPSLVAAQLFVACEADTDDAPALLAETAGMVGEAVSLCRIRHALRHGDPKRAEVEATPYLSSSAAPLFWPYISLTWRIMGDDRAAWLDQPDYLIQSYDAILPGDILEELVWLLRSLHTGKAPYADQSIRGGTQTDRSVLLRHEPVLQKTRTALLQAVQHYVDALPSIDRSHPVLGISRIKPLLIEGSWSVRLLPGGHNVPHTHPKGWLSATFYVDVPADSEMGTEPAGHISFGLPPPELGLDVLPYKTIQPVPNRLAVFPSTMWHGTVPFEAGERLVIAFDIARPDRP